MLVFLKNWIEQIAITVIIASIIEMILPNGNLKKYIKIILGVYILFSIINPFVNSKELYKFDLEEVIDNYSPKIENKNKDITKNIDDNLEKVYIDVFKDKITKEIEKYGFNIRSILIDASFNTKEENIGIRKILIVLSSKNNNFKNKEINNSNKKNEIDKNQNNIIINSIEEIKINVNKDFNENKKEKDESIKISSKEIDELKDYLSEHYDIEKKTFEIKSY